MIADDPRMSNVSRETLDRLAAYESLIKQWNPKINLISKSTEVDIWNRHFADSLQFVSHIAPDTRKILDIGSGGGFPGLVIAISRRDLQVHLVESDQRKAAFLRTVSRNLELGCKVLCSRIENLEPQQADLITARALAPLPKLLGFVDRHLAPNGYALLAKGRDFEQEVEDARQAWTFDCEVLQSQTHQASRILRVSEIKNA